MNQVMSIEPISNFRQSQQEIIDKLDDGPIVLTHHGVGAGVLVSIRQWNQIARLVDSYDDNEVIRNRIEEMENDPTSYISYEEFEAGLKQQQELT